jgi:hypothetical protein
MTSPESLGRRNSLLLGGIESLFYSLGRTEAGVTAMAERIGSSRSSAHGDSRLAPVLAKKVAYGGGVSVTEANAKTTPTGESWLGWYKVYLRTAHRTSKTSHKYPIGVVRGWLPRD